MKKNLFVTMLVAVMMLAFSAGISAQSVPGTLNEESYPDYLSFTAVGDSVTIGMDFKGTPNDFTLEYATSKSGPWSTFAIGGETKTANSVALGAGETMYLRNTLGGDYAITALGLSYSNCAKFTMTGEGTVEADGNIMSLLDNTCTSTEVGAYGFHMLFYGCASLTKAPELPAMTLAECCYEYMFHDCTGLKSAPELPATTLANDCYYTMFDGCTALTEAPELPAMTLAEGCYENMFEDCTGLISAPELPATTLAESCYFSMFYGCTALTEAPELPATTLKSQCYSGMFSDCTALIDAPELPATTLTNTCYMCMFGGCSALESAPELPATILADYCYMYMFMGCSNLTSAPELPATTLTKGCYSNMFYGCTGLTSAPELPATTLVAYCYYNMFNGCTDINSVTVAFTDWNESEACTTTWLNGVAATGTFTCPVTLDTSNPGTSGVPEGWTVTDVLFFTDVAADAYYFDSVKWAVKTGVTNGTSGTTFSPDEACTRSQVVTFLYRAAGKPEVSGDNTFVDVKASDYYYNAVLWAAQNGITSGTDATHFSPEEACTRGQAVTFLWRAADEPAATATNPFSDVKTGEYYYDAVLWAVEEGITSGTSLTTFSPGEACTRAQIVTFLCRNVH